MHLCLISLEFVSNYRIRLVLQTYLTDVNLNVVHFILSFELNNRQIYRTSANLYSRLPVFFPQRCVHRSFLSPRVNNSFIVVIVLTRYLVDKVNARSEIMMTSMLTLHESSCFRHRDSAKM